jgi:glycosyltransferase involved in cell wall biosynthesis
MPLASGSPAAHDPVRVLHLIESLAPGGAEHQLLSLLRSFERTQVRSVVVTLRSTPGLTGRVVALGVPVISLDTRRRSDFPAAALRLRRLIHETRTELVHTRLTQADLIGRAVAASCPGVRVMSTVEAPVYSADVYDDAPQYKVWKVQLIRALDALSGRLTRAHYVACSEVVARSTGRALHLPADRLTLIRNSVDVLDGRTLAEEPRLQPGDQVRLLCVGRLSPQKGHRYLLEAMPGIVRAFPRTRLQLAGAGPLGPSLQARARELGVEQHVDFLGVRDDVRSLMQSAHVMVMPSLWEGLSIVALEALAAGLPTVTSDIPAMREAFGDSGVAVLVAPRSPDQMAAAVVDLLRDDARRNRMSIEAQIRAKELFDVTTAAVRYAAVYRRLARHCGR